MKDTFDYNTVPHTYLHCLQAQCSRADECLRHQVALHATSDVYSFRTVNPTHIAGRQEDCPFFQPDRLYRFAMGITHLFDNLPHKTAIEFKDILYGYFKKTTYYRIRNKERLIRPEEQEYIRRLFLRYGISETPVFDTYIDQYDWRK